MAALNSTGTSVLQYLLKWKGGRMARTEVDRVLDEVDNAMKNLKESMRGIPFRRCGFKSKHDELARAVATLTVNLDAGRSLIT